MKTIFLHIGLHKTGTTSIQVALTSAQSKLAKVGILYPQSGRPSASKYGQHEIAWSLFERMSHVPAEWAAGKKFGLERRRQIFESLLAEIEESRAERIVISSEEFDCLSTSEVNSLAKELNGYRLCPIIYLRCLSDFIESAYRTTIIYSSETSDIRTFAGNQRTRLDFHQLVLDWLHVAHDGVVYLADYDDKLVRSDSLAIFRDCLGVDDETLPALNKRQNESLPAAMVEMVRYMRKEQISAELISEWRSKSLDVLGFDAMATLMPPDLDLELRDRYEAEIEKIHAIVDSRLRKIGKFSRVDRSPRKWISSLAEAILDA